MEIKETKEAIVGLNEIAILLIYVFRDGVQAADALTVIQKVQAQPELMAKLLAMYNGIDQVAAEMKEISLMEGIELAKIQMEYVPKIVAALSAKQEIVA